jgi:hypothetical protein
MRQMAVIVNKQSSGLNTNGTMGLGGCKGGQAKPAIIPIHSSSTVTSYDNLPHYKFSKFIQFFLSNASGQVNSLSADLEYRFIHRLLSSISLPLEVHMSAVFLFRKLYSKPNLLKERLSSSTTILPSTSVSVLSNLLSQHPPPACLKFHSLQEHATWSDSACAQTKTPTPFLHIFLITLNLATKLLYDNPPNIKSFAKASDLPLPYIVSLEKSVLELLEFQVHIAPDTLRIFTEEIKKFALQWEWNLYKPLNITCINPLPCVQIQSSPTATAIARQERLASHARFQPYLTLSPRSSSQMYNTTKSPLGLMQMKASLPVSF